MTSDKNSRSKTPPHAEAGPAADGRRLRPPADCAILDAETRFRLITETIEDVFWLSTPGVTRMIYVSPAYETIWGRSCESLYREPRSFIDAIHPEDRERVRAGLADHRCGAWDFEYRVVRPDGEVRWVHDRGYPIRDGEGRLSCLTGIATDITRRRAAEAELRRSETSLAAAQRIARMGNWDWDIANGSLRWSDGIYRIFGLEPRQFAATYDAFLERVHPDDRGAVIDAVNAALESHRPYQIDHRIIRSDGTERVVHEQGEVIFDAGGKPERMIGTVQDITELKRSERALQNANRALHTLSRCNETLVHARNETELLDDICRTVVEAGGYRMAWVGYAGQEPDRRVQPISRAGHDAGYVDHVQASWADDEHGRGPVGRAIRHGATVIVHDVAADPAFAPWREEALRRGYRSVIALPLRMNSAAFGCLAIYSGETNRFDDEEVYLLEEMAEDLGYGIRALRTQVEHEKAAARERKLLLETIGAMALTIEKRDPYTAGHQIRVAQLATAIARELGYDEHRIEGLRLAAMVHDIGKIYVPAEILNRPGRLTLPEFEVIKTHVEVGYDILKTIDFPWPVADIVRQHHERLDGSGYPQGLRHDSILPEARILAVADVVESIHSHRPYRPALGMDVALKELADHRGTRYDAAVVDACLRLFREERFRFA